MTQTSSCRGGNKAPKQVGVLAVVLMFHPSMPAHPAPEAAISTGVHLLVTLGKNRWGKIGIENALTNSRSQNKSFEICRPLRRAQGVYKYALDRV